MGKTVMRGVIAGDSAGALFRADRRTFSATSVALTASGKVHILTSGAIPVKCSDVEKYIQKAYQ